MYVIETTNGNWFCSESKREIEKIIGKEGSIENFKKCKNFWYQPWNYLSGAMSDFFQIIKNGEMLETQIPMRKWDNELPLSECKKGIVKFIGKKEPKWYNEVLYGFEKAKERRQKNI